MCPKFDLRVYGDHIVGEGAMPAMLNDASDFALRRHLNVEGGVAATKLVLRADTSGKNATLQTPATESAVFFEAEDISGTADDGSATRSLGMMFKRQIGVQGVASLATPNVDRIFTVNVVTDGPDEGYSRGLLSGKGTTLQLETINTAGQIRNAGITYGISASVNCGVNCTRPL